MRKLILLQAVNRVFANAQDRVITTVPFIGSPEPQVWQT
jgi:hypothetical protein